MHNISSSYESHHWINVFFFSAVNDITSTLDIKVHDESIIGETLGKISIPLLRIINDEKRWYALKDKTKKSNAKGNCPRILLQMSIVWNPVCEIIYGSLSSRNYTKHIAITQFYSWIPIPRVNKNFLNILQKLLFLIHFIQTFAVSTIALVREKTSSRNQLTILVLKHIEYLKIDHVGFLCVRAALCVLLKGCLLLTPHLLLFY